MARILVIGGGIAGISAAYFLSDTHEVVVVEAEKILTHHTTGRSAALFFATYGHPDLRPLTHLSRGFMDAPPEGLTDSPILTPRGALNVARPDQKDLLDSVIRAETDGATVVTALTREEAIELVPALRRDRLVGGLLEPDAADIDVAGLHQGFVRGVRRNGGAIRTESRVQRLDRDSRGWIATTADSTIRSDVVVNAAGAWGDVVAAMAEIPPVGLTPKRRTAFMVPASEVSRKWPLVFNVAHEWYFKPDGVQMLCSPADETPMEPCDVRHDELDVAIAIERINEDTTLGIRSVRSAWAGLRTFAPDGSMVIGFEPDSKGFFWLVGQGGAGIQNSPGAGMLTASIVNDREMADV